MVIPSSSDDHYGRWLYLRKVCRAHQLTMEPRSLGQEKRVSQRLKCCTHLPGACWTCLVPIAIDVLNLQLLVCQLVVVEDNWA